MSLMFTLESFKLLRRKRLYVPISVDSFFVSVYFFLSKHITYKNFFSCFFFSFICFEDRFHFNYFCSDSITRVTFHSHPLIPLLPLQVQYLFFNGASKGWQNKRFFQHSKYCVCNFFVFFEETFKESFFPEINKKSFMEK